MNIIHGVKTLPRLGVLLRDGNTIEWLAPDVLGVPWWRVLYETKPIEAPAPVRRLALNR